MTDTNESGDKVEDKESFQNTDGSSHHPRGQSSRQ